ncbi:MAG: two-component system response regulator [Clostridia bacterium BRH_c25]|nr:MAG: two-component system response regulator [Clostridia bacterium BRH_c25]
MSRKIVIADDAAFMRMMLKNILVQGGYQVIGEAENGLKAIAKYIELKPDLITLDITMPEMDGITAAKEILKRDKKANVIMCSAMGQQAIVVEAIMSGAKDFIVKPFQSERVIEAIKKIMG